MGTKGLLKKDVGINVCYDETFSEHPVPSQVDIEKVEDSRFVDRSQTYSSFGQKKISFNKAYLPAQAVRSEG